MSETPELVERLLDIVRKDHRAWLRALKKHHKAGNELAVELCLSGAQNDEQLLKKMEREVRTALNGSPDQ